MAFQLTFHWSEWVHGPNLVSAEVRNMVLFSGRVSPYYQSKIYADKVTQAGKTLFKTIATGERDPVTVCRQFCLKQRAGFWFFLRTSVGVRGSLPICVSYLVLSIQKETWSFSFFWTGGSFTTGMMYSLALGFYPPTPGRAWVGAPCPLSWLYFKKMAPWSWRQQSRVVKLAEGF